MKTKKGKENTVALTNKSKKKNKKVSSEDKNIFFTKENRIPNQMSLEPNVFDISIAGLGQDYRGQGSVMGDSIKYGVKESSKDYLGKKTKGNSTIQSSDMMHRVDQSKKGFLNRQEHDKILSTFRDEFSLINIESEEDFTYYRESHKHETIGNLEIKENSPLQKKKMKDKGTNYDKSIRKIQEEPSDFPKVSSEKLFTEKSLSQNYSYNETNNLSILYTSNEHINQNFMNYYKSIFDNLKMDTYKSCKSIESFLLNNTNDFHIQSNKHFLETLDKKFFEIFTLENQTINFIDHQLEKSNEVHNPFPRLLKNINDFHNYDITKSKVFEIFENLTEKLDQNYEANKNSKNPRVDNENNNNLLKNFFNNKFTYRTNTTGCFKISYKRGRKYLNDYTNEKLNNRVGLNKLDNNINENNIKSKDTNNSHRKASQQLSLNEDSYNLTDDGDLPQNENNICLNSSQTDESVQNEESEIEDENKQNDKFLDGDFCLSDLNWKKLSNNKPHKLTRNKEIGEYMFESTEAPTNLKYDKEEFKLCENNLTIENKISINNKYESNDNGNKGFTIPSKFSEDKIINSPINDNFFFSPSQENFIILDNIDRESKNSNQSNMLSNYFDNESLSNNLDDIKSGNNNYLEDSVEIKEYSIDKLKVKEDAVSLDPMNNQCHKDNLIEDIKENEVQGIGSDIIVSLDNSKENIDFQIDIENELELINSLSTNKIANNDKLFEIKEEKKGKDQMNIFSDNNMNKKNNFKIDLTNRVEEINKTDKLQLNDPIQANREIQTEDTKDLYSIKNYSLGDLKICFSENDKEEGERSNIIKIPKFNVDCSSIPQTTKEKNGHLVRDKLENLIRKEKLTYRNLVVKKINSLKKKQKKNLDLKMLQDCDIIKSLIYMSNRKLSCKFNQKDKKLENSLLYILEKLERLEMKNIKIHVANSYKEEVDNEINGYLNIEDTNDYKIKQFSKLKTLLLKKSLDDNFSLSHFTNNFKNSLNLNKYFYQKNVNNCFKNKNNKIKEDLDNQIFDLEDILNLRAAKDIQVSEDSKSLENASTIKIQKIENLDNESIHETNGDDFSNTKNLENGIKYFLHNLDNLSIISENITRKDNNPLAYLDLLKIVYCLDNQNDNNDYNIFSNNFSLDNLIANNKKINSFIEKIVKYADRSRKYSTGKLKKLLNANLNYTERIRNPINLSEERTEERKIKIFLDNFSEDNSFMKNKENTISFKQDVKTKIKETKKKRTKNKKLSNIIEIPNYVSYEISNDNKKKDNSLEFKNNSNHNLNRSLITTPRMNNSTAIDANENSALKNYNLTDKKTGKPFNEKRNSFIISKVRSEKNKTSIPNQGEISNKQTTNQNSNSNKTQNIIINIENNSDQKPNQESDNISHFDIEKRNLLENENILVNLIEDNQDNNKGIHITQLHDNQNERTCQKKYENIFNAIEELTDNESKISNHVYPTNSHLSVSEIYQKNNSNYRVDNSSNIHENNFIGENNSKKYNNIIKIDTGMFEILNVKKNDDKEIIEKKRANKVGRKKFNLRKNGVNNSIKSDIKILSETQESKDLEIKLNNNAINNIYTINHGEKNETGQNITKIPFENLTSLTRESNENKEIRICFNNKNFNDYSGKNETKINNTIRPQSNESTIKSEEDLPKHINISFPNKKSNLEIIGLSNDHRTDSYDLVKNKINFKTETITKIFDSNDSSKFTNDAKKISHSTVELINKTKIDGIQEEKIMDLNSESQIIKNSNFSVLTKNLSNGSIIERFNSNHSINSKLETAESINNKLKESIDKKENKPEKNNIFTSNKGVVQEKQKDKIEKIDSEKFVSSIEKTKEDTILKSYNGRSLSNQYSKESIFNSSENTKNLFNAFTKDLSNMKLNLNLNLNVNLNVNVKSKGENKKTYFQNEKEKSSRKRDLCNQMNQTSNSYVDMVNKSTSSSKIPIANNHTNIINNNTTNNFIITSPRAIESNKILKYSVLSGFNSSNKIGTNQPTENKSEIRSNQMHNSLDLIFNKKNYVESYSGINAPLNKNTGDQNFTTKSMLGNKRYRESLISNTENQTLQQKLNIGLLGASSAALLENSIFKNSEKKEFAKYNFSYQNSNNQVKGDQNNTMFESGFINNIKKNNLDLTEHFNSKIFNNSILRNILTDKLKDLEENIILKTVNPEPSVSKYNDKDTDNTHIKDEFQLKNSHLEESILKEKEENENTKTVTDTCSDTEIDNAEIYEKNSTNVSLNNRANLTEKKLFANRILSFNNDIKINKNNIKDKNSKDNFLVSSNNKHKNDSFNKYSCEVDEASFFGNAKKICKNKTNSFNSKNLIGDPCENIFLGNLIKNKETSLIHKADFKGISKDKKIENVKSIFKNKSLNSNKESPKLGFPDDEKSNPFITENNKIFSLNSDNHMSPKIPNVKETTDNLGNTYRNNNIINNTLNNNFFNGTDNLKYIESQISALNCSYDNQNLKYSKTFSNDWNKRNNGIQLRRNLYDILNFKGNSNSHSINKDINNLAFSNSVISNKKSINNETPNIKIDNIKFPYYENSRKNNFFNIPNEPFYKITKNSNIMATENNPNLDIENPFSHNKHIPLFPNLNNTIQKNKAEDTNKNNSGFNLDDFFVKD